LEERGTGGFGYDPIFYLPRHNATMAELPPELKNQLSHRARAVQAARGYLEALLAGMLGVVKRLQIAFHRNGGLAALSGG
jgi:XTP/dITP diphosphohydrolase